MESSIGRIFRSRPYLAVALTIGTIATDFALVLSQTYSMTYRACLALAALILTISLTNGDIQSLGFQLSPKQGWRYWISASIKIGLIIGLIVLVAFGLWIATGHTLRVPTVQPELALSRFLHMCVVSPIIEEILYRVMACALIASLWGHIPTIVFNGLTFGLLHVLYGNPSPENIIADFFLAWAYFKSETIFIPIALHFFGNAFAFISQVVSWYFFQKYGQ